MHVPPWAGFVADFPDDQVEGGGDIQVYGGHNVAVALGEIFAALGCVRVSAPESSGEQGWEFDFYDDGRHRFWCRIQSFHPVFWLLLEDLSGSKKGAAAYVDLWRRFGNALEQDPRFHKILWRSFDEGPPHWDEVEAAIDPPERTLDETFPLLQVSSKRRFRVNWLLIIWIWFTLSGAGALVAGLSLPAGKARSEDIGLGIFMLAACLSLPASVAIEAIRRRLAKSRGSARG